jgi:glucose/arabinose dehydrogenase/PKD repeat protein
MTGRAHSFSRLACLLAGAAVAAVAAAAPVHGRIDFELPGFREEVVAAGLPFATAVVFDRDGRMFIALKSGVVRVWRDGALVPEPFIDLSDQVNDVFDRGLLGLALHPQFPEEPYVYLLFTRDPPGVLPDGSGGRVARLVRVTADAGVDHVRAAPGMTAAQNPSCLAAPPPGGCPGHVVLLGRNSLRPFIGNELDGRDTSRASCMAGGAMGSLPLVLPADDPGADYPEGTRRPIEDCSPVDERTHTIGSVAFGKDGALFVSAGDGANFNEVDPRALRSLMLDSLAGKVLRLDPDTGDGLPDNPFFDPDCPGCNRSKVWSRGLRNPFRFAIDPVDGEPVIGDVGWNTWEEVNRGRGANFGWPCYEGAPVAGLEGSDTESRAQPGYAASAATAIACAQLFARGSDAVQAPLFSYAHEGDGFGGSGGAAVNAGAFYRGDSYPEELRGALFLLDFDRRWIRALRIGTSGRAGVIDVGRESRAGMVQITEGPGGDLYVVVFAGTGSEVRRIRYSPGNTPPVAVVEAAPVAGDVPLAVQFEGGASFDPDGQSLDFAWDFGDGGSSDDANPQHVYLDAGTFAATLTVTETTSPFASASRSVLVRAGTIPPTAVIFAPSPGSTYRIGDRIAFSGQGTASGVAAAGEQMSWELHLRHNQHVHIASVGSGTGGSFAVEDHGDATSLELCLTVVQSAALAATDCVELSPELGEVRIGSDPPGMSVVYEDEGLLLTTPVVIAPVVGSTQRLTVPFVQQFRTFAGWDDGEAGASRDVVIGEVPVELLARFVNRPPVAKAGVAPRSGTAPLPVTATAVASLDPEAGPLAVRWRFADEATSHMLRATHTFALPGEYTVDLTVTDPLGASSTDRVTVEVAAPACACGPAEPDGDGDGVCDRFDVCAAAGVMEDVRLVLYPGGTAGTQRLSLRAAVRAGAMDPVATGLRLQLADLCGTVLVDAVVPGGDDWVAVRDGWIWRGRHPGLGRLRLAVQQRTGDAPNRWWVRLAARGASAAIDAAEVPASLALSFADVGCAESGLAGPEPRPRCRSIGSGRALRCEAPR